MRFTPLSASPFTVSSVYGCSHSSGPKRDWKLMRNVSGGQPKASRIRRQVFTQWQ
jgi:hypothetical protein